MMDRLLTRLLIVAAASCGVLGVADRADARARSSPAEERQISLCIRLAAGGKPWLEKTLWGLRDQEGGWVGAAVLNTNGTHDLGPLQVNSRWIPRIAELVRRPPDHVRHWLRNDPCFNAEVARWIFLSGLSATRDYWRAIGLYHSPTDWRQRRYSASVADHLQRRFGVLLFRPPSPGKEVVRTEAVR